MKGETGACRAGEGASALNREQRLLVEKNLGLVGLHIRRSVRNASPGQAERDYDDLFQEGCVGLAKAARSFDPRGDIPFAAWALPRIHTAVSAALYGNESLVRRPSGKRRAPRGELATVDRASLPRVYALEAEPPDTRRTDPSGESGETVGDRLRSRYERAVTTASRAALRRKSPRNDRERLVDRVAQERLRVPEPDARTPLRRIARETGSSYSRVVQCERLLKSGVRRALAVDLEFEELQRLSRREQSGGETALDDDVRSRLRVLAAEAFWRRLQLARESVRADVVSRLLSAADGEAIRALFAAISEEVADDLLSAVSDT